MGFTNNWLAICLEETEWTIRWKERPAYREVSCSGAALCPLTLETCSIWWPRWIQSSTRKFFLCDLIIANSWKFAHFSSKSNLEWGLTDPEYNSLVSLDLLKCRHSLTGSFSPPCSETALSSSVSTLSTRSCNRSSLNWHWRLSR